MASYSKDLAADRQIDIEAQVLGIIRGLLSASSAARLSIGDITRGFRETFGAEYERRITEKWIGSIVRKRLRLKTHRVQGVFVIAPTEGGRMKTLFDRYGLTTAEGDVGDIGDVGENSAEGRSSVDEYPKLF